MANDRESETRQSDHRPFFDNGINLLAHNFRRRIVAHFGMQMLRARIDIQCARQHLAVMQGEGLGFQCVSASTLPGIWRKGVSEKG